MIINNVNTTPKIISHLPRTKHSPTVIANVKMTAMKNILTLFIGLTFVACNNSTTENKSDLTTDSNKTVSVDSLYIDEKTNKTEIVIKNKGDYSEKFIQGLKGLGVLAP